jgi:putative ABC transport system permease protein
LLVESLLLSAIGGAGGAVLAQVLSKLLIGFISSEDNPIFLPLSADWRVLLFTTALGVLTCLLCGLAPALEAARSDPGIAMKGSGRGTTEGRRGLALRRELVVLQVALSVVLVMGALLFVRTFRNLVSVDAGLRQDGVLVADFDFSPLNLPVGQRPEYKRELLANIRSVPGVDAAGEVINVPMTGNAWNRFIDIPEKGVNRRLVDFNAVSGQFFRTLEVPLLAGRDFEERDVPNSPPVAIVNERFAQQILGGGNPIGVTFRVARGKPEEKVFQIVGLVGNTKYRDVREDFQPIVFLAVSQNAGPDPDSTSDSTFVIRSEGAASLVAALKELAERTNPEIVLNFSVLRVSVLQGLARERLMATLSGFYGALAAVLAMVGLYGVISYMVVRRKKEIGIRMAMGAGRIRILRMILLEAMVLLAFGLGIGVILVLAMGRAARAMLYGVKATDAASLALAMGGLGLAAVCASLIPAARATGLQPVEVLREE